MSRGAKRGYHLSACKEVDLRLRDRIVTLRQCIKPGGRAHSRTTLALKK